VSIRDALQVAMILVSLALLGAILLQVRGEGLQAYQGTSLTRTRRGLEKALFQLTVGLAVLFVALAALNLAST